MSNPEDLLLATFLLDMQSDQCGYPICCPGNQPKFQEVNFFPTSISHLNMEADIRELMEDTAKIFHETGMPMLPCLLHHFCLPFSPICAAMYCANQRKSRLDDLIKDFNHQKALEKGIFIEWNSDYYGVYQTGGRRVIIPVLKPGLNVKMNVTKRQEYCSRNGIAFEMPEFPGPITQPPFNTNVAPDAPPPYGAPYPPPMGAPYPPPGAPYPPSGEAYPPPNKAGYLPPQHPEQRQWMVVDPGPSHHHHHHHHDHHDFHHDHHSHHHDAFDD